MNGTRREMTTKTLWTFFAMAFGLSWGTGMLLVAFPERIEALFGPMSYTNPFFIFLVYAPGLSGIFLVIRHFGLIGFRSYLKRLTLWRMPLGWAAYMLLGIPAAFYIGAMLKGEPITFPFDPWYSMLPALLIGLAIGPIEEFGWRGVALPLLQRRFRPIAADLILSTIWAVWHVPAFFMSGTPQSSWSFPAFFVGVVAISFTLTPLFNASGGSILLAALYHFQMNNPIWPDAHPYDSLVFALIAIIALAINRKAMFTKGAGVTSVLMPGDEERLIGQSGLSNTGDSSSSAAQLGRTLESPGLAPVAHSATSSTSDR